MAAPLLSQLAGQHVRESVGPRGSVDEHHKYTAVCGENSLGEQAAEGCIKRPVA